MAPREQVSYCVGRPLRGGEEARRNRLELLLVAHFLGQYDKRMHTMQEHIQRPRDQGPRERG